SSLDVLSRFPFSIIKFDQGVVRRMAEDARNTHIIRSSLHLARELSLKTVAEGVEDRGTYVFLMASGCDEVQGYWISKPVAREDFVALFNKGPSWPSSSLGLLYNAWVNHMTYRRKVLDAVYSMSLTNIEEWTKLPKTNLSHSPARCRLGMWYLGEQPEENGMPELNGLEEPHRLMHASGDRLVKSVQENEGPEAVKKALRVFFDYSDVVDANVSSIVQRWLSETLDGGN
ncbi:MAG: EAL domain-containing protein, partial [Rhodospirillales bacterium]|nr:EAL domain-containing protein [Rhodospirillales bacterium]